MLLKRAQMLLKCAPIQVYRFLPNLLKHMQNTSLNHAFVLQNNPDTNGSILPPGAPQFGRNMLFVCVRTFDAVRKRSSIGLGVGEGLFMRNGEGMEKVRAW